MRQFRGASFNDGTVIFVSLKPTAIDVQAAVSCVRSSPCFISPLTLLTRSAWNKDCWIGFHATFHRIDGKRGRIEVELESGKRIWLQRL